LGRKEEGLSKEGEYNHPDQEEKKSGPGSGRVDGMAWVTSLETRYKKPVGKGNGRRF